MYTNNLKFKRSASTGPGQNFENNRIINCKAPSHTNEVNRMAADEMLFLLLRIN